MTGVTVAVLLIGLVATGVGTMLFLRSVLLAGVDTQAAALVQSDLESVLFDAEISGNDVIFTPKVGVLQPGYFVAIYGPEGTLLASTGGGEDEPEPEYPAEFRPDRTQMQGLVPFTVESSAHRAPYRAAVDFFSVESRGELFTRMVALPIADVNRVVATYAWIYGTLGLLTVIAGALGTRLLVTLAFRSLGTVERTAMSIAAGDFSQRMTDVESPSTEVGRLKSAINAMLGRVDEALSQRDASVQQMRRFIGDASHELRTPLVTVRGYAELYRMGAITGDEDTAQAMERIEKEAMRMGVLVEDLLALARLDETRDVNLVPVDLRPIARDAALDVRATAPQRPVTVVDSGSTVVRSEPRPAPEPPPEEAEPHPVTRGIPLGRRGGAHAQGPAGTGHRISLIRRRSRPVPAASVTRADDTPPMTRVELTTTPSSGPAPIVLGDDNRIRQVVANLVGNARRYTPEDSPIELAIGVDTEARLGWIAVVDHGEGIPPQIRDKIFQRFWRADTSRTRETGGSGLGLSIVASIVETLQGTVSVHETPGGGATFRVAFPLAPTDISEHLYIDTVPLPKLRDQA